MAEAVNSPVATAYTYDFIRTSLPEGAKRLLEIGCGAGELASCLAQNGFDLVGLDASEECVAMARSAGVDAKVAEWPAPIDGDFDAVLFTRSLHHITPLRGAIEAALAVLNPDGVVLVEDFRFELESARTRAWFMGLMEVLDAAGLLSERRPLAAIRDHLDHGSHAHQLHASTAIADELRRHGVVREEDAAYHFRYAEPSVDGQICKAILHCEAQMIEIGAIDPLGKRFVLTPRQ